MSSQTEMFYNRNLKHTRIPSIRIVYIQEHASDDRPFLLYSYRIAWFGPYPTLQTMRLTSDNDLLCFS